ncbi:hypothetical protein C500_08432 [Natrialba magadii ATCC 43099]|nr:hypothetical protein C500_08432 [Natrialba magadii ATCC 43099]
MTFAWGHHLGDSDTVDLWHEIGEPVQAGLLRFSGTIEEDGQTWADVAGVPADEAVEEGDEVELMPLYDNAVTIAIRWEGDPDDPVELSNRSVSVGNP